MSLQLQRPARYGLAADKHVFYDWDELAADKHVFFLDATPLGLPHQWRAYCTETVLPALIHSHCTETVTPSQHMPTHITSSAQLCQPKPYTLNPGP